MDDLGNENILVKTQFNKKMQHRCGVPHCSYIKYKSNRVHCIQGIWAYHLPIVNTQTGKQ